MTTSLFAGPGRRETAPWGGIAGLFHALRQLRDFSRELERHDDERIESVGFHDKKVRPFEPVVERAKPIAAALHFHAAINAEQRDGDVPAKTATGSAGERHTLGSESMFLKQAHDSAFGPVAFLSG